MPPVITAEAIEGVNAAAVARNSYLAGDPSQDEPSGLSSTREKLVNLIKDAQQRGSFRDYIVLLLEDARLGLLATSHGISSPLMEMACLINPFLHRVEAEEEQPVGDGIKFAPSFRTSDLELVTESERVSLRKGGGWDRGTY